MPVQPKSTRPYYSCMMCVRQTWRWASKQWSSQTPALLLYYFIYLAVWVLSVSTPCSMEYGRQLHYNVSLSCPVAWRPRAVSAPPLPHGLHPGKIPETLYVYVVIMHRTLYGLPSAWLTLPHLAECSGDGGLWKTSHFHKISSPPLAWIVRNPDYNSNEGKKPCLV